MVSDKFDKTIEELIKELKDIKEVLEKGNVIDITKRLKQKRDSDQRTIERKQVQRIHNKKQAKSVHQEADPKTPVMRGQSHAGVMARQYSKDPEQQAHDKSYGGGAYKEHKDVLEALKDQPKPKLTKDDTEHKKVKTCENCGNDITTAGHIGKQRFPKEMGYDLELYNCPNKECSTTVGVKVPHKSELAKSLPNGQWSLD